MLISLSIVISPTILSKKMDRIQAFFESLEWLPTNIKKHISYITPDFKEISSSDKQKKMNNIIYLNPIMDWSNNNSTYSNQTSAL